MNRRTMLKRLGAAAAGTAAVGGTASAEREVVEIDGERVLVRTDLDVDVADLDVDVADLDVADLESEGDEIDAPTTCYGPCYSYCDFCYA